MGSLKRFKSFKAARRAYSESLARRSFDPARTERFLQEFKGVVDNPYKPGLYKFKSFEEARAYDLDLWAKAAAKNGYLFLKGKKEYLEKK